MSRPVSRYVDPRGPRFGAWVTSGVLAAVLLTGSVALLAAQTVVFLLGAGLGLSYAPYGRLFRLVRRTLRLRPPTRLEAEAPPRFAQAVGAGFGVLGTAAHFAGLPAVTTVATAMALGAAFLNAGFGVCLGCEMYLLARRALGRAGLPRFVTAPPTKEATA